MGKHQKKKLDTVKMKQEMTRIEGQGRGDERETRKTRKIRERDKKDNKETTWEVVVVGLG